MKPKRKGKVNVNIITNQAVKGILEWPKTFKRRMKWRKVRKLTELFLWKYARKDKNGEIVDKEVALMAEKIDNLMKEKEEGTLTISGSNDVLSMTLGTLEHARRMRGVGGNVKPSAYFKVPRKKRECVSKVTLEQRDSLIMETRKMMEEQQKRHEAAQQALQNQIKMLKVVINTQVPNNTSLQSPNIHPSPILSEKASTNIERKLEEGEKEICGEEGCEDVVEQTESESIKEKECKMAFGKKANLVASGTIVEINGPNQLVHNVPLGEGNIRVAVNCALKGDSPLPIPVKGVLETVEDVVGSQVAWPQDLIVFDDKVKKRETTKEKLANTLFKSISPTMPKSCKVLYAYAHQVMSKGQTISTNIDEDIFGVKKIVYIVQEQVIAFAEMREIGQAIIIAYISYLFRLVKSQQKDQVIGFMDPARTAHDPRNRNLRSEYITKCLKQMSIDSIFLIPYNPGGHWILTIIDEDKDNVYVMDPLGARHPHDAWKTVVNDGIKAFNAQIGRRPRKLPMWIMLSGAPKQSDGKSCGYFVMRYMKDICKDSSLEFRNKYRARRKDTYTQMELDEAREELASHVLEWLFD